MFLRLLISYLRSNVSSLKRQILYGAVNFEIRLDFHEIRYTVAFEAADFQIFKYKFRKRLSPKFKKNKTK